MNASGPIQASRTQGDKPRVSFKKLSRMQLIYDCQDTNDVDRIDFSTGQVHYPNTRAA